MFDAVFVMDVLEHVDDPEVFISGVHRILKPGGLLLLHCPCEGQPGTLHWLCWKFGIASDLKREIAGHVQRFTHKGLVALVTNRGFSRRGLRYSYHPFGQFFDLLSFCRQKCQRNCERGRSGRFDRLMIALPWYRVVPALERLAGLESRLMGRVPLAMGIDACFVRK